MITKFIACLLLTLCLLSCNQKKTTTGGLTPQQALSGFKLPEGFKIELVASEPMISDPVAIDVDEYGNLYVIELHGYPLDTAGLGKIKLLTDSDGDGIPDKSTLFADHLRMPTGIMRWKKGVIVVDVPEIIYLEDSDNDARFAAAPSRQYDLLPQAHLGLPSHVPQEPDHG